MSNTTYGAVILAAGEGSRLASAGVPRFFKPLLQVDGKFLIEHSFDFVQRWGVEIKDAVVVTSPKLSHVVESFFPSLKVTIQPEPTGVLSAIKIGMSVMLEKYDKILILCSDNTYGVTHPAYLKALFEDKNGQRGQLSAVTIRHFDDKKTRDRLTGFHDGMLWKRGTSDDAWSWIGPLVLHRDALLKYLMNVPLNDVYDSQLLEDHLNEIAGNQFIALPADCADWGVLNGGKENI